MSAEGKARIFSSWSGLPASAEKDTFVLLTAYVGSLTNNWYVDGQTLTLVLSDRSSKYWQTDPRKTGKKLPDFRKSLHVQRRVVFWWGFWEAGFGLLSWAPWFWRSGERSFDQRRMIPNFRDPSGHRHVGGRRRDMHTADKVWTHGQTLLFYRYRWTLIVLSYGQVSLKRLPKEAWWWNGLSFAFSCSVLHRFNAWSEVQMKLLEKEIDSRSCQPS